MTSPGVDFEFSPEVPHESTDVPTEVHTRSTEIPPVHLLPPTGQAPDNGVMRQETRCRLEAIRAWCEHALEDESHVEPALSVIPLLAESAREFWGPQ